MSKKTNSIFKNAYFWTFFGMFVGSVASLVASFVLSLESLELAKNPEASLSCNVNVLINCATVAKHWSAELLGFPNSFLGMMAEPVVMTVAIAGMLGVKFPRGFMFTAQIVYTLGFIFALYLLWMSYNVIGALCPWCLLVTTTTTLVWFSITRYNILEDNLFLPRSMQKNFEGLVKKDFDQLLMWVLIVGIAVSVLLKYGEGIF